jgi:hypothetical protein
MIHQVVSGPSRDQLFHLSTAARVIPYRIVNGVAVWGDARYAFNSVQLGGPQTSCRVVPQPTHVPQQNPCLLDHLFGEHDRVSGIWSAGFGGLEVSVSR